MSHNIIMHTYVQKYSSGLLGAATVLFISQGQRDKQKFLKGGLNLFEEVRINFFQDLERSNLRFEVESCKNYKKLHLERSGLGLNPGISRPLSGEYM
jgi:hypothetical protein